MTKVTVIGARDLPKADTIGKIDAYYKIFVGGVQKYVSEVVKNNFNPYWSQHTITVSGGQDCRVEIWDKDKVGRDDRVGVITVVC